MAYKKSSKDSDVMPAAKPAKKGSAGAFGAAAAKGKGARNGGFKGGLRGKPGNGMLPGETC